MKHQLKAECHRLMREMWKSEKEGKFWLLSQLGYDVHFADINDPRELKHIHSILLARYKRKGYERA